MEISAISGWEGTGLGFVGFLRTYHPSAGVHFDDAKWTPLRWVSGSRRPLRRPRRSGGIEHLGNIHFVNMVRAEHREIIGVLVFNEVHVLENGVGGAHIPIPPVRICAGTGSMYWPRQSG